MTRQTSAAGVPAGALRPVRNTGPQVRPASSQCSTWLVLLLPDQPAVAGLLALILLTDARRHARTDPAGRLLRLAEQDRARWDHGEISEGLALALLLAGNGTERQFLATRRAQLPRAT